jgi:predicted nucleic acid-binding protein
MAWVVDSCVVLDIALDDPLFGESSAKCLTKVARYGLFLCPVTQIEIAPCFNGDMRHIRAFSALINARLDMEWLPSDTEVAMKAWHAHVMQKKKGDAKRRPVADVMIGAFALRAGGLITRNKRHFSALYPELKILEP